MLAVSLLFLSPRVMCNDASRQIEKFADDEEQLLSTMRDPDGSEGLGLELGEEDLLFPGHRMAEAGTQASKTVAPPVDRLDPTVPHSEEFDYTFQEMMQAAADEEEDRSAALRQRQGTAFSLVEIQDLRARMHLCYVCSLYADGPVLLVLAVSVLDCVIHVLGVACHVSNGLSGHREDEQGTWTADGRCPSA